MLFASPYADQYTLSRDAAGAAQEVDWRRFVSAIDHPKLSSWHECVLRAWRRAVPAGLGGSTGVVRADFTTPPGWTP